MTTATMTLDEKRQWIIDQFRPFYEDQDHRTQAEASSSMYVSLCHLSQKELDAVEAAIDDLRRRGLWLQHWGSIGHDIHGIASRDETFLPRLVGRERRAA